MESFDKMISKILALFHSRKHESKETIDKIYLQNDKFLPVVCELLNAGQTVTLKARGYSMRPFIEHDRDDLIFAKADRDTTSAIVWRRLRATASPFVAMETYEEQKTAHSMMYAADSFRSSVSARHGTSMTPASGRYIQPYGPSCFR